MRIAKQKQLQAAAIHKKIRMEGLKMANNKQIYITSTLFFLAVQRRCCCFTLSTAKDTVIKKTVQDTP